MASSGIYRQSTIHRVLVCRFPKMRGPKTDSHIDDPSYGDSQPQFPETHILLHHTQERPSFGKLQLLSAWLPSGETSSLASLAESSPCYSSKVAEVQKPEGQMLEESLRVANKIPMQLYS